MVSRHVSKRVQNYYVHKVTDPGPTTVGPRLDHGCPVETCKTTSASIFPVRFLIEQIALCWWSPSSHPVRRPPLRIHVCMKMETASTMQFVKSENELGRCLPTWFHKFPRDSRGPTVVQPWSGRGRSLCARGGPPIPVRLQSDLEAHGFLRCRS